MRCGSRWTPSPASGQQLRGTVLVAYADTPAARGPVAGPVRRGARGRAAGGQHPVRARRRPVRLRPRRPRTTRATSRRSSRRRTPPTSSARSREINSGILAFDAEFLARRPAPDRQRQRQGRVLPHRHRRSSRARPGCTSARTRSTTSGRPRAPTTAPSSPRSAPR